MDEDLGWIGRVHRRTDVALGYGLHPQEAAVVRGMVLGDRSLIPEELEEAFQRSGITHVLAISGQHVAVLTAVIYFSYTFAVPAATRILTTLALMWLYILVAGAPPSAIRAGSSPRSCSAPGCSDAARAALLHDDDARRGPL